MICDEAIGLRLCFLVLIASQVLLLVSISDAVESNNTKQEEVSANGTVPNITAIVDNAEDLRIIPNETSNHFLEPGNPEVQQLEEEERSSNDSTSTPLSSNTTDFSNITTPHIGQEQIDYYNRRTAHRLASKFMGSLFVAYILICVILAIKNGPMFTY